MVLTKRLLYIRGEWEGKGTGVSFEEHSVVN